MACGLKNPGGGLQARTIFGGNRLQTSVLRSRDGDGWTKDIVGVLEGNRSVEDHHGGAWMLQTHEIRPGVQVSYLQHRFHEHSCIETHIGNSSSTLCVVILEAMGNAGVFAYLLRMVSK